MTEPDRRGDSGPIADGGHRTTLVVAGFLLLHVVFAHVQRPAFWGAHLLEFYPVWGQAVFAVLGAALLIPSLQRRAIDLLSAFPQFANPWGRGRPVAVFAVALVAVGSGFFFLLRAKIHLLGDGQLHAYDLQNLVLRSFAGQSTWANNNSPLCYWLVEALHLAGRSLWESAELSYQLYSICSGAMYLLVAVFTARLLGTNGMEMTIILGFLITPGFLQLFAGYVETYSFPTFLLLLYLYVSLRALRSGSVPWLAAAVLGVLLALHFAMVTLVPSLLALIVLQARSSERPQADVRSPEADVRNPEAVARSPLAVGAACLGTLALVSFGLLTLIRFDPLAFLQLERSSHLLPVLAEPGFLQNYRFFDPAHLLDVFNQVLLVAPAAVITVLLLRSRRVFADRGVLFVLSAGAFPLLFVIVANPEIGAFRDWDAFAHPAVPLTLAAAMLLIRQKQPTLARSGLMIVGASLLHTLLWVGVNARPSSSMARFEGLLERCHLSTHARSYGWESIGTYHWNRGEIVEARTAYERAIDVYDANPRYWNTVGILYGATGDYVQALEAVAGAIELDPDLADAHFNQGQALFALKRFPESVESFRKAVALDPTQANWHYKLGVAHYQLGQVPGAGNALRTAIEIDPNHVDAYFVLSVLYQQIGRPEQARLCARRVLELEPNGPRAGTARKILGESP